MGEYGPDRPIESCSLLGRIHTAHASITSKDLNPSRLRMFTMIYKLKVPQSWWPDLSCIREIKQDP